MATPQQQQQHHHHHAQQQQQHTPRTTSSILLQLGVGMLVGAFAKTLTAPLTRVNIVQVTTNPNDGFSTTAEKIIDQQGVLSLWRGNLMHILRYIPQQLSTLLFTDVINQTVSHYHYQPPQNQSGNTTTLTQEEKEALRKWNRRVMFAKLIGGAVSGILSNLLCIPFDFARTRMGLMLPGKEKESPPSFFELMSSTPLGEIYAGVDVLAAGAVTYRVGQLIFFAQIQNLNPYKGERGLRGALSSFVAVTLARAVVLPMTYALDTVRRRMMMPGAVQRYSSGFDALRKIVDKEGVAVLFAGIGAEFLRGMLGSIIIVAYDIGKGFLLSRVRAHAAKAAAAKPKAH